MALLDYQTSLGRSIRASAADQYHYGVALTADERTSLEALKQSPGFQVTVKVQRSWCAGRAAKAAYLTLSILPDDLRQRLLEEWTGSGGGTRSFIGAEADCLLDFIAANLTNPSHEFTVCRFEQATLRAGAGANEFKMPNPARLDSPGCLLRMGRYAAMVPFFAEPDRLLRALLMRRSLPPLSGDVKTLLFGPGIEGLSRNAEPCEMALCQGLKQPMAFTVLRQEGHGREVIENLLKSGVIEYAGCA